MQIYLSGPLLLFLSLRQSSTLTPRACVTRRFRCGGCHEMSRFRIRVKEVNINSAKPTSIERPRKTKERGIVCTFDFLDNGYEYIITPGRFWLGLLLQRFHICMGLYWPSVRSRWLDIGQVLFLRVYGPRRSLKNEVISFISPSFRLGTCGCMGRQLGISYSLLSLTIRRLGWE